MTGTPLSKGIATHFGSVITSSGAVIPPVRCDPYGLVWVGVCPECDNPSYLHTAAWDAMGAEWWQALIVNSDYAEACRVVGCKPTPTERALLGEAV